MACHTIIVYRQNQTPIQNAEVNHNSGICGCGDPTWDQTTGSNGETVFRGLEPLMHTFRVTLPNGDQQTVITKIDTTGSGHYYATVTF